MVVARILMTAKYSGDYGFAAAFHSSVAILNLYCEMTEL